MVVGKINIKEYDKEFTAMAKMVYSMEQEHRFGTLTEVITAYIVDRAVWMYGQNRGERMNQILELQECKARWTRRIP